EPHPLRGPLPAEKFHYRAIPVDPQHRWHHHGIGSPKQRRESLLAGLGRAQSLHPGRIRFPAAARLQPDLNAQRAGVLVCPGDQRKIPESTRSGGACVIESERTSMSILMQRAASGALLLLALASGSAHAADAEHGKALFAPYAACHSDRPDALGPSLKGVFGRQSASLPDFRYSNPMKRANLVWDEANLRAYISDPQGKVKGNRMPFSGMNDPKDVNDVVAYLKTLK